MNQESKTPRILELDYETSPAKGYFFGGIWQTDIIEIIEYEQVLSVAWKFYGDKTVKVIGQDDFKGYKGGILNDESLVKFFKPIIDSADIIVAHNGDDFDIKVFNTRLLNYRMEPIPVEKTFDTKKLSKRKFHFPSNKLDFIADFLGIPRKLAHTGKNMWLGCEQGNPVDWALMKKYNKHDVVILDQVLKTIMPYMKQINDFVTTKNGITCSNALCLSRNTVKHKMRRVRDGFKQQYQCKDCGAYWTDTRMIKKL